MPTGADYDIGVSLDSLTQLWVDPVAGNDGNSGANRDQALRTFTAAWGRVPEGSTLTTGFRIRITTGTFAEGQGEAEGAVGDQQHFQEKGQQHPHLYRVRHCSASAAKCTGRRSVPSRVPVGMS